MRPLDTKHFQLCKQRPRSLEIRAGKRGLGRRRHPGNVLPVTILCDLPQGQAGLLIAGMPRQDPAGDFLGCVAASAGEQLTQLGKRSIDAPPLQGVEISAEGGDLGMSGRPAQNLQDGVLGRLLGLAVESMAGDGGKHIRHSRQVEAGHEGEARFDLTTASPREGREQADLTICARGRGQRALERTRVFVRPQAVDQEFEEQAGRLRVASTPPPARAFGSTRTQCSGTEVLNETRFEVTPKLLRY